MINSYSDSIAKSENITVENHCPICGEGHRKYLFVIRGLPISRCPGCDLVSVFPYPNSSDYRNYYKNANDDLDPALLWTDSKTERDAALSYLAKLIQLGLSPSSKLLLIAPPEHLFAVVATEKGYILGQHITGKQFEDGFPLDENFDAVVILFQLEKSSNPFGFINRIRSCLSPGGIILLTIPSLDSPSANFFGSQWTEWRPENRFYFNHKTIQLLLWGCSFDHLEIEKDRRQFTLEHIDNRARAFPKTTLTRLIHMGYQIVPPLFRKIRLRLPSSGIVVTAQKNEKRDQPACSIILPVYKERETFSILMNALLQKQIEGVKKEIVVIESNSKDGTREQVLLYKDNPEVKIILQDRPRGKGNAVREGFKHATGDIILIQDADLEYDLNDYEALLEPVMHLKTPFVLGARHGGSWKMRQFEGQQGLSGILNLAHIFFTTLINILYGQRMKDPFTMYKVFRRDCIWDLEFESNRFDFDHELVIKLVRKGYTPVEIPVNYHSRSFKEGKKVQFIRDPLTWLWVDFKYRFVPLRKKNKNNG
jgi:SAM-dependent methyltransferase